MSRPLTSPVPSQDACTSQPYSHSSETTAFEILDLDKDDLDFDFSPLSSQDSQPCSILENFSGQHANTLEKPYDSITPEIEELDEEGLDPGVSDEDEDDDEYSIKEEHGGDNDSKSSLSHSLRCCPTNLVFVFEPSIGDLRSSNRLKGSSFLFSRSSKPQFPLKSTRMVIV